MLCERTAVFFVSQQGFCTILPRVFGALVLGQFSQVVGHGNEALACDEGVIARLVVLLGRVLARVIAEGRIGWERNGRRKLEGGGI